MAETAPANDVTQYNDGDTITAWGGWDGSTFYNTMTQIDVLTGAIKIIDVQGVVYQTQGFVENDAWDWTPGWLLYLTTNGQMTQERPVSGPITVVGIAWTDKIICLDPRPPK